MSHGESIDNRLAVYGTLAPGQANHNVIADAGGSWSPGYVHGFLRAGGWGSALGFLGLIPDPDGPPVAVHLLVSDALPCHLARLDAFEGSEYERVRILVQLETTTVDAWVFALRL